MQFADTLLRFSTPIFIRDPDLSFSFLVSLSGFGFGLMLV